jgi:hypothetical protein
MFSHRLRSAMPLIAAIPLAAPSQAQAPAVELEGYFARPDAAIRIERIETAIDSCQLACVAAAPRAPEAGHPRLMQPANDHDDAAALVAFFGTRLSASSRK